MTDFNDIMTMYPENLLNVIFGETDGRLRSCPAKGGYAADMDGMLAYLLETVLTERERTVIKLRFEDSKTYEQTGKVFHVSRERARQVEHKALRKLTAKKHYLTLGMNGLIQRQVTEKVAQERKRIFDDAAHFIAVAIAEEKASQYLNATKEGHTIGYAEKMKRPIEELKLSTRPFNCLKRAGINTVGDIMQKGLYGVATVHTLGRKSLMEIVHKLAEWGLTLEKGDAHAAD